METRVFTKEIVSQATTVDMMFGLFRHLTLMWWAVDAVATTTELVNAVILCCNL